MLYLVTGGNGTGKTLFTLRWARDLQLEFKEKHGIERQVYYSGFDALSTITEEFGWLECDPTKWMELPDNSIVIVDEAQNVFKLRSSSSPTPDYEHEIAISHRKRGFDFYIVTQHPSNISAFLRRLIANPGWHRHLKRIMGMEGVNCIEFNYADTSCERPSSKLNGTETKMAFPKEVYGWYKSAEIHTGKRNIPKTVYILAILVSLIAALAVFVYLTFTDKSTASQNEAVQPTSQAEAFTNQLQTNFSPPQQQKDEPISTEEYIASFEPRIEDFPHTAPRYDEITKPVTAPVPSICGSMEGKGCRCYSQQGTRMDMPEETCLAILEFGYFIDWETDAAKRAVNDQQPLSIP